MSTNTPVLRGFKTWNDPVFDGGICSTLQVRKIFVAPNKPIGSPTSRLNQGELGFDPATKTAFYSNGQVNLPLGSGSVGMLTASTGITLAPSPIITTGTIGITPTGVTPGTYTNPTVTLNAQGQATSASNGSAVGSISQGTGIVLSSNPITTTGSVSIGATGVTAGTYSNPTLTVNAQGQLTAASSGAAPSASTIIPYSFATATVNSSSLNTFTIAFGSSTQGVAANSFGASYFTRAPFAGVVSTLSFSLLVGALNLTIATPSNFIATIWTGVSAGDPTFTPPTSTASSLTTTIVLPASDGPFFASNADTTDTVTVSQGDYIWLQLTYDNGVVSAFLNVTMSGSVRLTPL